MYRFNADKILLQRALRNTRSHSAINNFLKQLELIEDLYVEIEKNIDSPLLIQQARKQLVISLVSALEVYFKDILKVSYDSGAFKGSILLKKIPKRFYFNDIEKILDHKISLGELLASVFTFQNLQSINKVFSELIGKNLFQEINQFQFELESPTHSDPSVYGQKTTILNEDKKVYHRIQELYSLRPFITHDQLEKSAISEFQVQNFLSASCLFAVVIDTYLNQLISIYDATNLK